MSPHLVSSALMMMGVAALIIGTSSAASTNTCTSCPVADCGDTLCNLAVAKTAPCNVVSANKTQTCGTCQNSYCSKPFAFFCTKDGKIDTNCTNDDDIKGFRNSTACWKWFEGQCSSNATSGTTVAADASTTAATKVVTTVGGTTAVQRNLAPFNNSGSTTSAPAATNASSTVTAAAAVAQTSTKSGAITISSSIAAVVVSSLILATSSLLRR